MSIPIGAGFKGQGKFWNFDRDGFNNLEEIKAFPEAGVPDGFTSYVASEKCRYEFHSENPLTEESGRWKKVDYESLIQSLSESFIALSKRVEQLENGAVTPPPAEETSNFITADGCYIVTADNLIFNTKQE